MDREVSRPTIRRIAAAATAALFTIGGIATASSPPDGARIDPTWGGAPDFGLDNSVPGDAPVVGTRREVRPGFVWTFFRPSPDTQIIFVSSSDGDDANDGRAQWRAVRTIERGKQLLRHGHPDWLLLKRGDTWETGLGQWRKGGRSPSEPMLVGTYGNHPDRPVLKGTTGMIVNGGGGTPYSLDNLVVTGLRFWAAARDPDSGEFVGPGGGNGLDWVWRGQNILFEDCVFDSFRNGLLLTGYESGLRNFQLRGCIVVDSYNTSGHSQGIYVTNVKNLLIEGCVFDHNGFNEHVPGAQPTIYNHNMYIDDVSDWGVTEVVCIRNNIIANAASHGVQLRPGGVISGNLLVRNSLGCFVGRDASIIRNNVIIEPKDISPSLARGFGIDILECEQAIVEGNILAHKPPTVGAGPAIRVTPSNFDISVPQWVATVRHNIVFNWNGPMFQTVTDDYDAVFVHNNDFQAWNYSSRCVVVSSLADGPSTLAFSENAYHSALSPANWFSVQDLGHDYDLSGWRQISGDEGSAAGYVPYVAPYRTLAIYQNNLHRIPTTNAFLKEARKQGRWHWRQEYFAPVVNAFFQNGFNRR